MYGCGNSFIFFILGIIFFLWFQLEVETFQVGVGSPWALKKNSWRGLGGVFLLEVQYSKYIEESNIYLCFVVCRLKRGLVT